MKKKLLCLLLALAVFLGLLPVVSAAETSLPDWYFLFTIFKNVDADGKDRDGKSRHAAYSMPQDEIDTLRDHAQAFEEYMNQLGVMSAHVDVMEIDTAITKLSDYDGGSWFSVEDASPFLEGKVDLDKYDHVFGIVSLNISTAYAGLAGSAFENGTGYSCIHFMNREKCLENYPQAFINWTPTVYVHEFLHFMEALSRKFDINFNLHDIANIYDSRLIDGWKGCYTDIILNRSRGNTETGTGVPPMAWQYPPHEFRTMREFTVPSNVVSIGKLAFQDCSSLARVNIHSGVTTIGDAAFERCTALTHLTIPSGVTSIGEWTFQGCTALTGIFIPASVTSIGEVAFYNTGLEDVYYSGTEAQWKAIQIGGFNDTLTNAAIHYNSGEINYWYDGSMSDVKSADWFAEPVAWAIEKGVAAGTGGGRFSPHLTCTQGQILTFIWRANGSPSPAGTVRGSEYYADALQWASEEKLISGTITPDSPCTRSDVVTYLWKLAGSPAAGSAGFSDVPDDAPYAQAVAWAMAGKITSGTGNGRFSPDNACTRGQVVTFLYNALAR